jgi:hypothetical protein
MRGLAFEAAYLAAIAIAMVGWLWLLVVGLESIIGV